MSKRSFVGNQQLSSVRAERRLAYQSAGRQDSQFPGRLDVEQANRLQRNRQRHHTAVRCKCGKSPRASRLRNSRARLPGADLPKTISLCVSAQEPAIIGAKKRQPDVALSAESDI